MKHAAGVRHLDYFPLINARAHSVGAGTEYWSLNRNFKDTYNQFLLAVFQQDSLKEYDKLFWVQYMQMQDRISEAVALFKQVDRSELGEKASVQYDYMAAYFDFFCAEEGSDFKIARELSKKYENYPVMGWRILFLDILDQLYELDGEDLDAEIDREDEQKKRANYKASVKKAPHLTFEVEENGTASIEALNIKSVVLKYYIIDTEVLFSRAPFLKDQTEEFSYVKPCLVQELEVPQNTSKLAVELPEELQNKNMVIEVNGAGEQLFKTFYSASLKVKITEPYGELKVSDQAGKVLPKTYVKVFAQKHSGSNAEFFRDGYTDIRGKFEYATSSSGKLTGVTKFSILVMSDTHGSLIREVNPPKQEGNDASVGGGGAEPAAPSMKMNRLL